MDWDDAAQGALALFLILAGVGLAYALFRLGELFRDLSRSVSRVTDETVPILSRAQTTVDGVNSQLGHVDDIMLTAVHTTKGAERAVDGVSRAVTTPVRKVSGLTAATQEAYRTFRARRAAGRAQPVYPPPDPADLTTLGPSAATAERASVRHPSPY